MSMSRTMPEVSAAMIVWEGNDSAKAFYESRGMRVMKTGMEYILEQEKEEQA